MGLPWVSNGPVYVSQIESNNPPGRSPGGPYHVAIYHHIPRRFVSWPARLPPWGHAPRHRMDYSSGTVYARARYCLFRCGRADTVTQVRVIWHYSGYCTHTCPGRVVMGARRVRARRAMATCSYPFRTGCHGHVLTSYSHGKWAWFEYWIDTLFGPW